MTMPLRKKGRISGSRVIRIAFPVTILWLCTYLLAPHFSKSVLASFPAQLSNIHWSAWCSAIALTAVSLWSVGRYDGVAHKHFATRIPQPYGRASGTIAIALAQTLGFGLFTGAFARWRMLRDTSLSTAFKLSTFVSLSFMTCWCVVTAIACLIFPAPSWTFLPGALLITTLPFALIAMFLWPKLSLKTHTIRFPNLQSSAAILFWTALDTTAAAGALYVLMPSGVDIGFGVFLPLFLLALGTALASNTPGGVGPFELMMLGLLPQLPPAEVLGSIVAFRIVYYAIPATFAALALVRPFQFHIKAQKMADIAATPQAEVQVIAQNGGRVLATQSGACAIWPTPQTLTALSNPLSGGMDGALKSLTAEARTLGKSPFFYKCNRQSAAKLRQYGWAIIHMSDDAIVMPETFDLDRPALRTLRRKLRNTEKAGVALHTKGPQPWSELADVDQDWQHAHGKARGGTMGRFEAGYLSNHFIIRAEFQEKVCAFVTFQTTKNEWCIDVMRHTKDVPDGTMHALVHAAITAARQAGVKRLSLAATPACPDPHSRFFRWAARQVVIKAGGTGLRQFKSSFAPNWEPRYAAAPNRTALVIGLADITCQVHNPDPVRATKPHEIHNFDEYYELASKRAS